MAAAGLIMPLISLIGSAASSGSQSANSGLTPQQAALQAYKTKQQILKNNSAMATEGIGASTMNSYADASALIGGAMGAAGTADANAAAFNNASGLQNLASNQQFNQGFGSQGGQFGNQGGSFSSDSQTS